MSTCVWTEIGYLSAAFHYASYFYWGLIKLHVYSKFFLHKYIGHSIIILVSLNLRFFMLENIIIWKKIQYYENSKGMYMATPYRRGIVYVVDAVDDNDDQSNEHAQKCLLMRRFFQECTKC